MTKELYVGHLSESTTEEDIRNLFSVMGEVTSIHLIVDKETREFKRCGYVRMGSGVNLNEVAETLDGAFLIDRVITVSIARPQKPGMSTGKTVRTRGAVKAPVAKPAESERTDLKLRKQKPGTGQRNGTGSGRSSGISTGSTRRKGKKN